ncbi:MAG: hypothetical protein ABSF45_15960 [Terriglobia bacterium]|jgi:hypothetical protein
MHEHQAAKLASNIRMMRGSVMMVSTKSTENDFYMDIPTGWNAPPVGVLAQDVNEPGLPWTSESDPTDASIGNGTTPTAPFTSSDRAWAVDVAGDDCEVIAADTSFAPGDLLICADVYGRVTKLAGRAGLTYHTVGRAKYAASAVNQRGRATIKLEDVKA